MKILLITLSLITGLNAYNYWDATDDKPFFQQRDNQAHIVGFGALSAGVGLFLSEKYDFSPTASALIGIAVGVLGSAVKEETDKNWDNQDFLSGVLGATMGAVPIIIYKF